MKDIIIEKLKQIEKNNDIKILYACESGSRAWGFESTDSDYDVRFIYVHPPKWYLSVSEKKDTIQDVGKVLDFAGWELKKVCKLMLKSNASLFEKIQSPVFYMGDETFREELSVLSEECFNVKSVAYHYRNLVQGFLKEYNEEQVPLKKYFYIWRSVLAMKWAIDKNEVPPMVFEELRELITDERVNQIINDNLKIKSAVTERFMVERNKIMDDFVSELLQEFDDKINGLDSSNNKEVKSLDELLFRVVMSE